MEKEAARKKLQILVDTYEECAKSYRQQGDQESATFEQARAETVKTCFYNLYSEPLTFSVIK